MVFRLLPNFLFPLVSCVPKPVKGKKKLPSKMVLRRNSLSNTVLVKPRAWGYSLISFQELASESVPKVPNTRLNAEARHCRLMSFHPPL